MSSMILNTKKDKISKYCLRNALTYIGITPPHLRFEIKPNFYSERSYLTKFHKACRHALRWRIVFFDEIALFQEDGWKSVY